LHRWRITGHDNISEEAEILASSSGGTEKIEKEQMVVDFDLVRRIAGRNLRDLGGHPTRHGKRVKRQHVYRSAHLATIPPESPALGLNLRTVITLQSKLEVSVLGGLESALAANVRWEHIPIGDKWFSGGAAPAPIKPGHEHLVLVTDFRDAWQNFFMLLAEERIYPMLFHCSAGRDRTGVGAAMLLEMLGVERERILADFLESNTAFPRIPLSPGQLEPVFALIDECGDIDQFLIREIGVSPQVIQTIRRDLLED
jgi:protein-tyrosine phosphatase